MTDLTVATSKATASISSAPTVKSLCEKHIPAKILEILKQTNLGADLSKWSFTEIKIFETTTGVYLEEGETPDAGIKVQVIACTGNNIFEGFKMKTFFFGYKNGAPLDNYPIGRKDHVKNIESSAEALKKALATISKPTEEKKV